MSVEREQRISVKRLMLGAGVQAAFCLGISMGEALLQSVLTSIGIAVVVVLGAVPSPGVTTSFLVFVAAFLAQCAAVVLGVSLGMNDQPVFLVFGLPSFVGATLFAMAVHTLLFGQRDLPMSLLVGTATVASVIPLLFPGWQSGGWERQHALWSLLFAGGLAVACKLSGRTIGSGVEESTNGFP